MTSVYFSGLIGTKASYTKGKILNFCQKFRNISPLLQRINEISRLSIHQICREDPGFTEFQGADFRNSIYGTGEFSDHCFVIFDPTNGGPIVLQVIG